MANAAHHSRRILLADDDEDMLDLLRASAKQHGLEIRGVCSSQEVTRTVLDDQPDVVVLDLGFPDADGRDLLRELKANPVTSPIPVIIWSGRSSYPGDRRVCLELGAEDYVEKGDPLLVVDKLEGVLQRLDQSSSAASS